MEAHLNFVVSKRGETALLVSSLKSSNIYSFIVLTDLNLQSKLLSQNNKSQIRLIKKALLSRSVLFSTVVISNEDIYLLFYISINISDTLASLNRPHYLL